MNLLQRIEEALGTLNLSYFKVTIENGHANILAVSEEFSSLSLMKRQQYVLRAVKEFVASGEVHAVNVKSFTPEQWEKDRLLYL